MKKLILGILALCLLVLCFSGCSRSEAPVEKTAKGSSSTAEISVVGTYQHESKEVDEQYWPSLTFEADGSCRFTVNLLTQMGHIDGTYTVENGTVIMTVSSIDFDGFSGDHVETLRFDVVSKDKLMYRGSEEDTAEPVAIGMTNDMDLFVKAAE